MNDALKNKAENLIFKFEFPFSSTIYNKETFHLDYENQIYRQDELFKLIRDAVPYFALTEDELKRYAEEMNFHEAQNNSWSRISQAQKNKKGDYGELLLFLLLSVHYKSQKFVTKVRLRSSVKMQVHGYDCAHFTVEGDDVCLWLGEAKFHQSFNTGFTDAISSLKDHCCHDFLKNEFSILQPNIEINRNHSDYKILENIFQGKSIDKIKFKIPILLTYDCNAVKTNNDIDSKFILDMQAEIQKYYSKIDATDKTEITNIRNIDFVFILFPLHTVSELKSKLVLPPNMQVKFKPFFCILMAISNPVYGSAIRCYNVR